MREMRRKERATTREEALALFAGCEYAVLSMTDPDGLPYAVPVSPVLSKDTVYIHCAPAGYKLDCLERQPYVCLVCTDGVARIPQRFSTAYESAVLCGTAQTVTDEAEKIEALRLICEKYAHEYMARFDAAIEKSLHRTAIIKVRVREASGKRHPYPAAKTE